MKVSTLHFPTETSLESNIFGNLIQDFLNEKIIPNNPELTYQLYANDRLEQKEKLKKMLENNDIVLCDRYMYSNLAYMGVKMAQDMQTMVDYGFHLEFDIHQIPYPKLVFFLDTDEKTLKTRYKNETKLDLLEKDVSLQTKAKHNYRKLENIIDNYYIVKPNQINKILNLIKK